MHTPHQISDKKWDIKPWRISRLYDHVGDVGAIVSDHRLITAGENCVFMAKKGMRHHGMMFAEQAVDNGAVAVITDNHDSPSTVIERYQWRGRVPLWQTPHPTRVADMLVSRWYPEQPSVRIAVTGTNGKTSVCHHLIQMWHSAGIACAAIGTQGVTTLARDLLKRAQERFFHITHHGLTTPDSLTLARIIDALAKAGVTHIAFEASSIALVQQRLRYIVPTGVVLLPITRDHLDYHRTPQRYRAAKYRLFPQLPKGTPVVVTKDSREYHDLAPLCDHVHWHLVENDSISSCDGAGNSHMCIKDAGLVERDSLDDRDDLGDLGDLAHHRSKSGNVFTQTLPPPLGISFLRHNVRLALTMLRCVNDLPPQQQVVWSFSHYNAAYSALRGVPGRMEFFSVCGKCDVVVDYAHTPDALARLCEALAPYGVCWIVLGCGGDRDRGKRALMGEVAARYAQRVVITDDNPRTEDPHRIRFEILSGIKQKLAKQELITQELVSQELDRKQLVNEGDVNNFAVDTISSRRVAIVDTIMRAIMCPPHERPRWIIVAGRGAEQWQVVADGQHRMDDRALVKYAQYLAFNQQDLALNQQEMRGVTHIDGRHRLWSQQRLAQAFDDSNSCDNHDKSWCALGVSIDTRTMKPGDLFVALPGRYSHGLDHLADAMGMGACAVIVGGNDLGDAHNHYQAKGDEAQRYTRHHGLPLIITAKTGQDALVAMAHLARCALSDSAQVVAITGSVGKTTTTTWLHQLWQQFGEQEHIISPVQRGYNNALGLSLSLSRWHPATTHAVVEMGTNARGEIASLTEIARPCVAVITAIDYAHAGNIAPEGTEYHQALCHVAQEKISIINGLQNSAILITPFHAVLFDALAAHTERHRIKQWVVVCDCSQQSGEMMKSPSWFDGIFTPVFLHENTVKKGWRIEGLGRTQELSGMPLHHAWNLALALVTTWLTTKLTNSTPTASDHKGVEEAIDTALLSRLCQPSKGRGTLERYRYYRRDLTIIDDAYNAAPMAMSGALAHLKTINAERWAILSQIEELGAYDHTVHTNMLHLMRESGLERVFLVGDVWKKLSQRENFHSIARHIHICDAPDDLNPTLSGVLGEMVVRSSHDDLVILVKGARRFALESAVHHLVSVCSRVTP